MNSILKNSIIALAFFVLALLQFSFLPHFAILGFIPNLVFTLFFTFVFFEKNNDYYQGIFITLLTGIVLDLFSPAFFGANMIPLLLTYALIKTLHYFLKDTGQKLVIIYFLLTLVISFFFYQFLYYVATNFSSITHVIR